MPKMIVAPASPSPLRMVREVILPERPGTEPLMSIVVRSAFFSCPSGLQTKDGTCIEGLFLIVSLGYQVAVCGVGGCNAILVTVTLT
jgi:hypothetical protein